MRNQQELVKAPELVLLETVIQTVQEIDRSQLGQVYARPLTQSSSYSLDSVIQAPYNKPLSEVVGNKQAIRDFWSTTPLFYKQFALGMAAVILGALIGFITPWLTASF